MNHIKNLIEEHNICRKELAEKLNMSIYSLNNKFNPRNYVSDSMFDKIENTIHSMKSVKD